MRLIRASCAATLLFTVAGWLRAADDSVFFLELPAEVLPAAVGGNAFAIAGSYYSIGGMTWMPTSGDQRIGGLAATAISRDGKVIAGTALDARGLQNAAIWQGGRNWRTLGSFTAGSQPCDTSLSSTYGASADGRVVVGLGWNGCDFARAFRWEESTGVVNLGSLSGRSTRANGVSGDGKVVVGWEDNGGPREGAKWVNGAEQLIKSPNGVAVGEAYGSNSDGSIIVGQVCDYTVPSPPNPPTAWMWTAGKGVQCFPVTRPPLLPPLPYLAQMRKVSDDGRVIGGSFSFGLDSESVIWLDGQVSFLKDYLMANGYPDAFRRWQNTGFVTGVSPDGRTLVGYGAGPATFQGYMVILPPREKK